ncbi:hypothetical protein [Pontibacter chinhatensis]|uniref:hypothetical protein n=1 Tax=Pontibacter chinhatensis TaxID=1436961 RepID=UPI00111333E9|nr:hypothetical protein [Pontibacter chinhatensis]
MKVEKLQADHVHTCCNAPSCYSSRQAPAAKYLEPVEVKILQASTQKPVQTLQEAVLALGRLVWSFSRRSSSPCRG